MKPLVKTYSIQLLLLAFCAIVLSACINDHEDSSEATSIVKVGDCVPDFSLMAADGQSISSTSLAGQVYVLNFFDTGCPDCQRELQVLQHVYDKYHETVPVLNVPRSQTQSELQTYWHEVGLTVPFFIPCDKELYYKFATKTIPRTYVVGADGKVVAAFDDSPIADFETLDGLLQSQLSSSSTDLVNLSLRVKIPTRGGDVDEYYFHNEYTISTLYLYFFDAETKQFFSKASVTGLTKEESYYDTQYDITYLFNTIRLHAGVYDIFTIANYDYAPDEVADEEEFLNMVDSLTYQDGIEANMPDKGPVMTNRATSLLGVDLVPWVNKNYVLNVELERVVAKLQIGVAQNSFQLSHDGKKYADINLTNYKLVNLNRRYYIFQHRDSLPTFTERPAFTLPYHFREYSDQGEQYVVDPYFYQKKNDAASVARFKQYYKSWFGAFTTEDFASMPSADNHGYAYILENTVFKDCQKNGYSPGIVFKGAVSPVFVYLYNFSEHVLKTEHRPEYWPKTIYLYKYDFYGSIQAINVASGLMLDELETYTDDQLKVYGIKQCKFNMGVYETFYTFWIHHRSNAVDNMGAMEYGIVRNNFYKLIVTGISGLGHSTITPDVMRDNYPNSYTDVTVN